MSSRYRANLARFNALAPTHSNVNTALHPHFAVKQDDSDAQSCADYVTSKERRRRRKHRLHNNRFSDRSGDSSGVSDVDSDLEMESRGRRLARPGDRQNCASGSRVMLPCRAVESDEEGGPTDDVPSDDVSLDVYEEVARFKELLAQMRVQEALKIQELKLQERTLCDDEESEDDGYESEDDYEDLESEGTRGSMSSMTSVSSVSSSASLYKPNRAQNYDHCHRLQHGHGFYVVDDFSSSTDPGRIVRVSSFRN